VVRGKCGRTQFWGLKLGINVLNKKIVPPLASYSNAFTRAKKYLLQFLNGL